MLYSLVSPQICTCQPGYTGEPTHGCQLIDYCLNEPCAPGALCENSRGSYKCHCQQGMVGDPYNSGCQPPVECLQDEDCPLTAKCINVNNVPKCFGTCIFSQSLKFPREEIFIEIFIRKLSIVNNFINNSLCNFKTVLLQYSFNPFVTILKKDCIFFFPIFIIESRETSDKNKIPILEKDTRRGITRVEKNV